MAADTSSEFTSLLRDFRDAYATHGLGETLLSVLTCPGDSVSLPNDFFTADKRLRYGCMKVLGGSTVHESPDKTTHYIFTIHGKRDLAVTAFDELSRRAGAYLPANQVEALKLAAQGGAGAVWCMFILHSCAGDRFVLEREGYRIVPNPFAASAYAIEAAGLPRFDRLPLHDPQHDTGAAAVAYANHSRDKWLYAQHAKRTPYKAIAAALNKNRKRWSNLSPDGVRMAINRYAKCHKQDLTKRKAGRPSG